MKKNWKIAEYDLDTVNSICEHFKISKIVAIILYNRGLKEFDDIESFLTYNGGNYHSPFLFKDMEEACGLIQESISENHRIAVFGDYDVDGITSVAILHDMFRNLLDYENVRYVLPERDDGYGLSEDYIRDFAHDGVKLLITVDCGICNAEEIKTAKQHGIRVIVTDHHELPDLIPEADAIINPKARDYPFSYLAGVGVTFKLIQGFIEKFGHKSDFTETIIDLVALGTIADIVPLVDENRLITREGLNKMKKHRRPGINAIMDYVYGDDINSRSISFGIAPRINASGRIGDPEVAFSLLITEDETRAEELALRLNEQNIKRQTIEQGIFHTAVEKVGEDSKNSKVIVLASNEWNIGVIGIVSSKLKDKFNRPAFLISIDEKTGIGKGSARSVPGFHLVEVLSELSDLIEAFGGHEFAAGFSIKVENIPEFHRRLFDIAGEILTGQEKGELFIDLFIDPKDITIRFYDELHDRFFPFGERNPYPVFGMRKVRVKSVTYFSKRHASLWITDGFYNLKAVCYNFIDISELGSLKKGDTIDVAFTTKLSKYKGESFIELQIMDFVNEEAEKKASASGSAEALRKKGNEFLFTGNYERALDLYNRALKFEDDDGRIMYNMGIAYRKKGDKAKAIQYLKKALRSSKDRDDDVYNKAVNTLKNITRRA